MAQYSKHNSKASHRSHIRLVLPPLIITLVFCFGFIIIKAQHHTDKAAAITASKQANPAQPQKTSVANPKTEQSQTQKMETLAPAPVPPATAIAPPAPTTTTPQQTPATTNMQEAPQNSSPSTATPAGNVTTLETTIKNLKNTTKSLFNGARLSR